MRRLLMVGVAALLTAVLASGSGATSDATICGAETDAATVVTSTSATLDGMLGTGNLADASACGSWSFEYGPTGGYGSSTPQGEASEGGNVPVSAPITGLTPDTTYHFRLDAASGTGNLGGDLTFHTSPTVSQSAVFELASSVNPTVVQSGANATFTIVAGNDGPADAGSVTVGATLPSSVALVSAASTAGSCSGTNALSCAAGTLPNGGRVTVTIVVRATGIGGAAVPATVSASNLDPGSQTTASATLEIASPPSAPSTTTPTNTTTTTPVPNPVPPSVVVDRSIGAIFIGSDEELVEQALGPPQSTLELALPGGTRGHLARYRSHGAVFIVVFDSGSHVVSLETYSPYYKSAGGLGPGSDLDEVARLPGFHRDYCELGYWNGTAGTKPTGVVTVFTPNGGTVASVMITELAFYTDCAAAPQPIPPPVTLTVDHSVGGVSIGMTAQEVAKLYGTPAGTLKVSLGGGKAGRLVRYRVHGAPLLITYDSSGHVVSIESYSPFFQTAAGIGPGSSLNLVKALSGFHLDFCELGYWNGTAGTRPTHVITVFTPQGGLVASVLITQLRLYTACDAGSTELAPA